jgi:hypothetical protein
LQRRNNEELYNVETLEALQFLARYYRDIKKYDQAKYYVERLTKVAPAGQIRDEANKM